MFALVFFGQFNPRWSALKDLQKTEIFGGAVLAASILFMGVYPKPFTDRITPSVRDLPGVEDPTRTHAAHLSPRSPSLEGRGSEAGDQDRYGLWLTVPGSAWQRPVFDIPMTPLPLREGVGG